MSNMAVVDEAVVGLVPLLVAVIDKHCGAYAVAIELTHDVERSEERFVKCCRRFYLVA